MLFVYIVCFAFIIKIKTTTMNGSGLREGNEVLVTSQQFHEDLRVYFRKEEFEQIKTSDDMYTWLESHLNERLYLPVGRRSPNWPIGATRMIQYRVRVDRSCFIEETDDDSCRDKYDKQLYTLAEM